MGLCVPGVLFINQEWDCVYLMCYLSTRSGIVCTWCVIYQPGVGLCVPDVLLISTRRAGVGLCVPDVLFINQEWDCVYLMCYLSTRSGIVCN